MQMQPQPWMYSGISEDDWKAGWRRTIKEAVEAASVREQRTGDDEDGRPGAAFDIQIKARKRSDNSVHDYIVNG